jgi:hypothetical protein
MSTRLSNPAQVKEHVMKIKICAGFEKCLSFGGRNMPDSAHYNYKTRQLTGLPVGNAVLSGSLKQ